MGRVVMGFVFLSVLFLALPLSDAQAGWIPNGVPVCTAPYEEWAATLVSDGAGGAIITWYDRRPYLGHIYAQRVSASGDTLWALDGIPICTAYDEQMSPQIVSDGAGGAIIVFTHYHYPDCWGRIYAQRVNGAGIVQWAENGISICQNPAAQSDPYVVSDGMGGAIIAWYDWRAGDKPSIYAQRVNGAGETRWAPGGLPVCTFNAQKGAPFMTADGAGGAIIAWTDFRNPDAPGNYAQRVSGEGIALWTTDGEFLCGAGWYGSPAIIPDGESGAIVTWATQDVYAQRINGSGALQWGPGGVSVCTAEDIQYSPQLASDGAGGAIITWYDRRLDPEAGYTDAYAQRVDALGAVQWTTDGVVICSASGYQTNTSIMSDGSGGAIIAWEDGRAGNDLYAQRVNASGVVQWTPDGVPICTEAGAQYNPRLVTNCVDGALICWDDWRGSTPDIYAQTVSGGGVPGLPPVATLLQAYSAEPGPRVVTVRWTLSEAADGMSFAISRRTLLNGSYAALNPGIESSGRTYSFVDRAVAAGSSYRYRIEIADGAERGTLFETEAVSVPLVRIMLHQNSPNPFNPSTTIRYSVPRSDRVVLEVFNVTGRLVSRLVDRVQEAGDYSIRWNAVDMTGNRLGAGVYVCRLTVGKESVAKKMVLAR